MSVTNIRMAIGASALALSLALAGCNRANEMQANQQAAIPGVDQDQTAALPALPATLPMTTGAQTQPTYAPAVAALPAAPRVRTVRVADTSGGANYAYADDAYGYADAIGDAPPDYGFDYDGVEPWAWQGYDGSATYAEPIDGGYRYYYYRAGAEEPYYVQDPDYGYGYDDGQLAVIYAASGAILPYADYGPRYDYAGRYLYRGRELYRASRYNRRAVIAANWAARRAALDAERARWAAYRADQAGWRDYHDRYAPQRQRYWQPEDWRRQADARRFAEWHRADFRTPPPPRAIPIAWQKADWARDERRYRPAVAAIEARQARREARGDAGPGRQPAALERRPAVVARPEPHFGPQNRPGPDLPAQQAQAQRQQQLAQRQAAIGQRQAQAAQRDQQRAARIDQRRAVAQARPGQGPDQARQARVQQRDAARAQRVEARRADQARAPGPQRDAARAQQVQARAAQRDQARAAQRAEGAQARQAQRAQADQARSAARGQAMQARQAQRAEQAQGRMQAQQARAADRAQAQQARAAARPAPAMRAAPQGGGGGAPRGGGAPGGGGAPHGGGAPGGGAPGGGGGGHGPGGGGGGHRPG